MLATKSRISIAVRPSSPHGCVQAAQELPPHVLNHWMLLQDEEEEEEDLQELMGHFRGMQVVVKDSIASSIDACVPAGLNCLTAYSDEHCPSRGHAASLHGVYSVHVSMTAKRLTACMQAEKLCCGLQMHQEVDKPGREPVLTTFDLEGIAEYIRSGEQLPQDASSSVQL